MITLKIYPNSEHSQLAARAKAGKVKAMKINGIWHFPMPKPTSYSRPLYRALVEQEKMATERFNREFLPYVRPDKDERSINDLIKGKKVNHFEYQKELMSHIRALHRYDPELSCAAKEKINNFALSEVARGLFDSKFIENADEDSLKYVKYILYNEFVLEEDMCAKLWEGDLLKTWTTDRKGDFILEEEEYPLTGNNDSSSVKFVNYKILEELILKWVGDWLDKREWKAWEWLTYDDLENLWRLITGEEHFWRAGEVCDFLRSCSTVYIRDRKICRQGGVLFEDSKRETILDWRCRKSDPDTARDITEEEKNRLEKGDVIFLTVNLKAFTSAWKVIGEEAKALSDMREEKGIEYVCLLEAVKNKTRGKGAITKIAPYKIRIPLYVIPLYDEADTEERKSICKRVTHAMDEIAKNEGMDSFQIDNDDIICEWNKEGESFVNS